MRGILRITRAEFNKIFKRPTVYIMAVVLVLACLISLFTFAPANRQDDRVRLSKENANTNYTLFNSTTGSDNKKSYDKTIEDAISAINKVKANHLQYTTLHNYKSSIIQSYDKIVAGENTPEEINQLKTTLQSASVYFKPVNSEEFNEYDKYLQYVLKSNRITVEFSTNSIIETSKSYVSELQETLDIIYNTIKDENDPEIIKNLFQSNKYLTTINSTLDNMENFIPYTLNCIIEDIKNIETVFKNHYSQQAGSLSPSASKDKGKKILNLLNRKISEFKQITDEIVTAETGIALVSSSNKGRLDAIVVRVKDTTDTNKILDSDTNAKFVDIAVKLNNDNYINQFSSYVGILKYVDYLDTNFVTQLDKLIEKIHTNQTALTNEIIELQNDVSTTRIYNSITSYKLMSDTFSTLVTDIITKHTIEGLTDKEITRLYSYDLKDYNAYQLNNSITYNNYYIDTNTYSNDYLNNYQYCTNIDYETNAYDYIYASLKICAFLILIFTMMMAAYLISSEYDSGTIKLLLMRPYSRGKILVAKMLATLFFSLTFLLLAIVVSTIGGMVSFGLPTLTKMLVSFNATKIFVSTPIISLLIYVATVILDIIFFLILSFFVAVVFKSFAGTVSISFITILTTVVLNLSLSNTTAYKYIPFTNISLFRFFGQNYASNKDILSMLLSTPIQSGMSIWLSIITTALFSLILYLITSITFKKRDY